jgi:LAO/AO transport system kinase
LNDLEKLYNRALNGDRAALGKLLTVLESSPENASNILNKALEMESHSHVIGVTGIPGSGKSTLISKLIYSYKERGEKIAVIAIDPTSPLSRGALLGDRIRMQEHATDPRVFIRSVPTRGVKGGLSFSGVAMVEVFDMMGYDRIIVESIGVGQTDIDIMNIAHTILVVTTPGLGDDIQALKAGVMEIGDIYVLNKSDQENVDRTYSYLEFALESYELGGKKGWNPRLIKASALFGRGIAELASLIDEHLEYIKREGIFGKKIRSRRKLMLKLLAEKIFLSRLDDKFDSTDALSLMKKHGLYKASIKLIETILKDLGSG